MPYTHAGSSRDALVGEATPVVGEIVRFVCRRRHCSADQAEEFTQFVWVKLLEDDGAVLRRFDHRSSLRTFLSVVIQRLFIDFCRQQWGVWRPSTEARRLGATAVRLDILVNRDGRPLDEAVQIMRTNEGVGLPEKDLRDLAARLPCRVRRQRETEEALADVAVAGEHIVEAPAMTAERHTRARALRLALREAVRPLPAEDAVVLRLHFADGLTVSRVAALLGLPAKPLYRRIKAMLGRLQHELVAHGFNADDVTGLLGDAAFDEES